MNRYKISLQGFSFTGFKQEDGKISLNPEGKPGERSGTAVICNEHTLEALSLGDAKERFKEAMGIISADDSRFKVEVMGPAEDPKAPEKKKEEESEPQEPEAEPKKEEEEALRPRRRRRRTAG